MTFNIIMVKDHSDNGGGGVWVGVGVGWGGGLLNKETLPKYDQNND